MPQRDVARATGATTAGTVVPDLVPDGAPAPGPVGPAGVVPASVAPAGGVAQTVAPASVAPAGVPPTSAPVTAENKPEPVPDARAAARAGLAAGRSPSLWWVCTALVGVLVVTFAAGATQGALVLAAVLAVSAVARAVLRPGPVALTVRSRVLDTAVLAGLAAGVGALSQLIPSL